MHYIILICLLLLALWEIFILPIYVEKKITTLLHSKDTHFIHLKLVTRKDAIFYVTYEENGITKSSHVKYNLFGHLKWL